MDSERFNSLDSGRGLPKKNPHVFSSALAMQNQHVGIEGKVLVGRTSIARRGNLGKGIALPAIGP